MTLLSGGFPKRLVLYLLATNVSKRSSQRDELPPYAAESEAYRNVASKPQQEAQQLYAHWAWGRSLESYDRDPRYTTSTRQIGNISDSFANRALRSLVGSTRYMMY